MTDNVEQLSSLSEQLSSLSEQLSSLSERLSSFSSTAATTSTEPAEEEGRRTEDTHYDMGHARRGVAVIINIEHFSSNGHFVGERKGSQNDVMCLRTTFRKLGFEVEVHCDLTSSEVMQTLRELSERDHSDCDCLIVSYMSHGLQGQLRASDEMFDMTRLFEPFTGEGCPTMINKPKLFFIQACQGHERQTGVCTQPEVNETAAGGFLGIDASQMITIPSRADMLFAISTIPGFVSWRSPVSGSWYIQALCRWLTCEGFSMDLLTILTRVTRQVAVECEFRNPFLPKEPVCKQLPFFGSSLLRTLKFTKKIRTCRSSKKRDDAEEDEQIQNEDHDAQELSRSGRTEEKEDEWDDSVNQILRPDKNNVKEYPKSRRFLKPNDCFQVKRETLERDFPMINLCINYFSGEEDRETQSSLVEHDDDQEKFEEIDLECKESLMSMGHHKRTNDEEKAGSSECSSPKRTKHH